MYLLNLASSQTDACGNGEFPFNVLCQNLGAKILGDGNAVNVIGLQTGGKILREAPEDRSCEECFERFLTQEQRNALIQSFRIIQPNEPDTPFKTLEQVCNYLELIADVDLRFILQNIELDPDKIDLVIECLKDAGVIIT